MELSGSALKTIAVVCMTLDHIGAMGLSGGGTVTTVLRLAGRAAFPIFAFLSVEGYSHTRSFLRYAFSFLALALLSEVPFDLAFHAQRVFKDHQNVMWTLFFGLCALRTLDSEKIPLPAKIPILALTAFFTSSCDYGLAGLGLVLVFRYLTGLPRYLAGACTLGRAWMGSTGFIPIALYNGKRGFIRGNTLKYAFYLYYPAHLTVLYLIKKSIIG